MRKYIFDTRDEAEKEISERLRIASKYFCPLIKDKCKTECVCFFDGLVRESLSSLKAIRFRIDPPRCVNHMFSGVSE